jgi:hypothetical protein
VAASAQNFKARIATVLRNIRGRIGPAVESIESDIFRLNRDRVIIAMANWLASK